MAVYDHEEQEQLSRIQAWWESYGTAITTIVVIIAVSALSWQGWQWYENKQAREASGIYFALEQAAEAGNAAQARDAAGRLISEYPRTLYAQMGALVAAGVQVVEAEPDHARAQLEWVADSGQDAALRDIARLRLAALLLDQGEFDAALNRLEEDVAPALRVRQFDLRGDVLAAQGRTDEARTAYENVLETLREDANQGAQALGEVVRIKLESLEAQG